MWPLLLNKHIHGNYIHYTYLATLVFPLIFTNFICCTKSKYPVFTFFFFSVPKIEKMTWNEKYNMELTSEMSRASGRGSAKCQLTAVLKMKEEGRQRGRGGTRDHRTNWKIRNVIIWHGWGELRGRGSTADTVQATREGACVGRGAEILC